MRAHLGCLDRRHLLLRRRCQVAAPTGGVDFRRCPPAAEQGRCEENQARVQASFLARYRTYQPEDPAGLFMVKPLSALAWTTFPGDVTGFSFSPA
jgi:hypothetical protein